MSYQFVFLQDVETTLQGINVRGMAIDIALENLASNPRQDAIPTCLPFLGEYYVNCGEYSILFDIDDSSNCVELRDCIKHSVLLGYMT